MAKFDDLLVRLDDDTVYSAGLIVRFAEARGYAQTWKELLRIRISLNCKCNRYGFPRLGDGWVRLEGQDPTPGWFGWRWKAVILKSSQESVQATTAAKRQEGEK